MQSISAKLPEHHSLNTKNYLNDKTLKMMDNILQKTQNQNQKVLKNAQKLFDMLLKQDKGFELYT